MQSTYNWRRVEYGFICWRFNEVLLFKICVQLKVFGKTLMKSLQEDENSVSDFLSAFPSFLKKYLSGLK